MPNWLLPATVTLVCWGLWGFVPKITTRYISPTSAIVYETLGCAIMGVVTLVFLGFRPDTDIRGAGLAVSTGILGMVGALGFLYAVKLGKVSVVAMFTALSPVVTVLLGVLLLKEALTVKEVLGMVCALTSIYLFTS
ncbi:MAG: EamA family transporter [Desulfovibrio sp.]|uniref:EamA family transporter n=1 Tax=Desulfovibrio sp. 7SRBS1 TaxID=3378064 RepID=UPI003B3C3748